MVALCFGIALLAGTFFITENLFLKKQADAYSDQLATLSSSHKQLTDTLVTHETQWQQALREKEAHWQKSLLQLNDTLQHFSRQADTFKASMAENRENLTRLVNRKMEAQRGDLNKLKTASSRNNAALASLKRHLHRDCDTMKKAMIYPTVQLRGKGTVGSGVIIFSGPVGDGKAAPSRHATFILSAYHVILEVTDAKNRSVVKDIRLMGPDDNLMHRSHQGRVIAHDLQIDIALLSLDTDKPVPHVASFMTPEALQKIQIFAPAYTVGCPLGNIPLPSIGEITTKQKKVNNINFWMFNAPTFFGNSGGGVFSADSGKLLGLTSMVYTYGQDNPVVVPHLGLFVPVDAIMTWLDNKGFGFLHDKTRAIPKKILCALDSAQKGATNNKVKQAKHGIKPAVHDE